MPITVNWINDDKTILYYMIAGEWSLDELWSLLNSSILELVNETPYVPDTLVNLSKTTRTPIGSLSFWRRSYNWVQANHLETSIVAFVQAPPAMQGIGDTLRNLRVPIMRYMYFVDSVEEGQKLIMDYRANNPRQALDNN